MVRVERELVTEEEARGLCLEFDRMAGEHHARKYAYERVEIDGNRFWTWRAVLERLRLKALVESGAVAIDYTLLTRMGTGDRIVNHADGMNLDGSPNHVPYRTGALITYLNAVEGGDLVVPRYGVRVSPRVGVGVVIGGGADCEHGVEAVLGGPRYSVMVWVTDDPKHAEVWG